jgi:hypothetical protein
MSRVVRKEEARQRGQMSARTDATPVRRLLGFAAPFALYGLAFLPVFSCAAEDGPDQLEVARLHSSGSLVVPDLTSATAWLGRSSTLRLDPHTNKLFLYNRDEQAVLEIDEHGKLVRKYGRAGKGPGEINNLKGLALTGETVIVLDATRAALVQFSRSTGEWLRDAPLESLYSDLTVVNDSLLAMVPGSGANAFDLMRFDGQIVASRGFGGWLPRTCTACRIRYLPGGRIAVIDSEAPAIRVFEADGTLYSMIDFEEARDDLLRWRQEFRELATGSPQAPRGKIWISEAEVSANGQLILAVSPERVLERGYELWVVSADEGLIARYRYDRSRVGSTTAGFPLVLALDREDGGIYRYSVDDP